MILAFLISIAHAGEFHGIVKNNEGVSRYDKGKPMDAYGMFMDALGDVPFSPEIQYNIGDTFMQMKDLEKAQSQFKLAIKLANGPSSRDREVRFRSWFNIGAILATLQKTDEALDAYQHALEEKPDSIETKTNMELLTAGGGGGGKGGEKKDKQGEGEGQGDQQKPPDKVTNEPQKNQPQPYKGKDLSKQDVDNILDELKQQEESIRAKDQRERGQDAPPDKDW